MSKVTLNQVGSLIDTTTAAATINSNTTAITSAFNNTLSLDGTSPNQMQSNLDMNSNQIINLPAPLTVDSPARLIDVTTNPTIVIPPTGTSGHVVPFLDGNNTYSGASNFTGQATFVNPILGTPASGVATNLTGTAAGLTSGYTQNNANMTGAVTSSGNATSLGSFTSAALAGALTDETGTGKAVFGTSPNITTPTGIVASDVGLGNVNNTSDANKPVSTAQATAIAAVASEVGFLRVETTGVNFNSAATDTAITFTLPSGVSRYTINAVAISGASGSLSTSTVGLFTATGGGGTAIASTQANTITTASENTANNSMVLTTIGATQSFNFTTLYFRVTVAQGSAATGNVTLTLRAL